MHRAAMKIAVIGGGPGGLFFAVLMKRADPTHEITVFERNARDATFGFGVVFPERSMRYLREADQQTHEAFTQAMIQWDALEYRHRGRVLRCGGHIFSGIARIDLLRILQGQARGLGVGLRFEHDVNALSEVAGYDLIAAADGLNSLARGELADQFRPSVRVGRSKYIWLGTTQVFTALTFIFEESQHGWFGAHIYPYGSGLSTFIVETDEDSWRRAGFDRTTEAVRAPGESDLATVEFSERLFARHLDGHRLLANNSRWLNFRTVRNRSWHAGNIVLVGDAAHTAHFSVGSGTRMALEDAIALAHALQQHRGLPDALAAYERERRPAVRRIQRAAEPSRRWWEGFRHWVPFEPEQFAFHHLARTRVLTYGTLTVRDAQFVKSAENWFAIGASADRPAGEEPPAPVLVPFRIGEITLPNRVVASIAPAAPATHAEAGRIAARKTRSPVGLTDYAMAGAGLVMTAPVDVFANRLVTPAPAASTPRGTDARRVIVDLIHSRTVSRIGLRLRPVRMNGVAPASLIDALDRTVRAGGDAGFDLLLLDCPEGSPDADRLALDLVSAARAAWPDGRPVCVHLSAREDPEDDRAARAGLQFAQALKARGCDLITVSMPADLAARDPERAREAHADTSDFIRNLAGVPTMMLGGDYTAGDINALILAGRTDLCEWPRLAWPAWRPAS